RGSTSAISTRKRESKFKPPKNAASPPPPTIPSCSAGLHGLCPYGPNRRCKLFRYSCRG
nr:hypothetical protein [Tanacetum cinerariifolium]